ncbi:rCG20652 [Rattus norvegicus]|uniref:RCG20652 n=1 Tax=Rattus norvegicus TaxID=10116 RepID=A6JEJ4_RAT|nr:rCG20652 [Rattus norvegicus]
MPLISWLLHLSSIYFIYTEQSFFKKLFLLVQCYRN